MAFFTEEGKRIHFVGITGVGMVGLATLLHEMGAIVTGSDQSGGFFTERILTDLGIPLQPFNEENVTKNIDEVVYSTAYSRTHPEIKKAEALGIRTRTYSEALAQFASTQRTIVVTGTHGKTTTTAMLAEILIAAGWDPSVLVGSVVRSWGRTARLGSGEWFIVEGDEYQGKFLEFSPSGAIITNIEYDHPDFFPTPEAYHRAFGEFVEGVESGVPIVMRMEDIVLLQKRGVVTSGQVVPYENRSPNLQVIGEHNQWNASAAGTLAGCLGVEDVVIDEALAGFRGTKRRLEFYSELDARKVYIDDYAHHPTEVRAALAALREEYQKTTITAIFQPHTFTRTEAFLDAFASAFEDVDHVVILPIYGSAREQGGQVAPDALFTVMKKYRDKVIYLETKGAVRDYIANGEDGVYITLGAGDLWKIWEVARDQL